MRHGRMTAPETRVGIKDYPGEDGHIGTGTIKTSRKKKDRDRERARGRMINTHRLRDPR